MDDFYWAESAGSAKTLMARIASSQFGDGYEQRAPDGLNPLKQVWDLVITSADVAIADEIDAFIAPRLGLTAFTWTPPRQTTGLRWKCTDFRRTLNEQLGEHSLSLRFEQVFGT